MIATPENSVAESARGHVSVLAVDPGRSKCGIAVVDSSGVVLYRGIVPSLAMRGAIMDVCAQFAPVGVLLGNGTGAATIFALMEETGLAVPLHRVDESYSSEEARALYINDHPARGLKKLIPRSLRYPDQAYDDYVAVLLARRWWSSQQPEREA